tara:strand:- start:45 stop:539 length:495 start_codon:yes stop_codon:yes gene_type:complete
MGLYTFPGMISFESAPDGSVDSSQVYENGTLGFDSAGNGYRYVEIDYSDAVDWAAGHPVGAKRDASSFVATADQSDALVPIGVALGTVDVSAYSAAVWTWIQVSGLATVTATDANITGGQPLIWSGDGVVDHFADGGEELVFAHAVTHTGTASANSTYVILHTL